MALKIKREPAGPVVRCVDRGRPGQGHPETGLIQLNTPTPQSVYIKRFLRVTSFRLQDPHPVSVKGSLKKKEEGPKALLFLSNSLVQTFAVQPESHILLVQHY